MYFFFPPWLRHGRPQHTTSIFSLDVQPHGTRLATCGQDCAVKIWHLPVLSQHAQQCTAAAAAAAGASAATSVTEATKTITPPTGALLATLSSHTAAVNVVRWAPNGTYLASAGDDHVVLIYFRTQGSGASSFGDRSAEAWQVRRPLRAHSSDVTDLAWSPDSERIASASVDNSIVVWNLRTESPLVRLDGHRGLVKGLAWDPVGRFLASQSDDRTVRIWRTSDWKTEKVISEPFETAVFQENSMTFFLRISWAPCGTHLVTTNAYRKPGTHHAPMFSRQAGFTEPIEFVGHREPVISSRFSPRLYRPHPNMSNAIKGTNPDKNNSSKSVPTYTVLALGSKDGGCTVWQATAARPFFEMYDAFEMEVIDLSWASDGYTMVACSTDGKVLYLRFEPQELGIVVPPEEARAILTEVWRSLGGNAAGAQAPLPESAVQLHMEEADRAQRQSPDSDAIVVIEPDAGNGAAPASSPEKRGNVPPLPPPVIATAEAVRANGPTPPADPKIMAAQAEVRVRGGKRRITPVSVSAVEDSAFDSTPAKVPSAFQPPMPMEISETIPAQMPAKRPRSSDEGEGAAESLGSFARNAAAVSSGGTQLANGTNGALEMRVGEGCTNGAALRMERQRMGVLPPGAKPVSHAAHLYAPSVAGLSMMLLPEKSGEGPGRVRVIGAGDVAVVLESREQLGGGSGGYVVTCSAGGKVKWRDYHAKSSPVTALAGVAAKFAAVGTADGMLYLYSATSGRRLTPPIAIDSAPYMLETYWFAKEGDSETESIGTSERWYVIVISRSALCSVFDVKGKKLVCARSAASLLARPVEAESGKSDSSGTGKARIVREICHCEVTSFGEPILTLSDGHGFVYSRDFCTWLRVADDASPNSEFRRTIGSSSKVGILRSLQSRSGARQKGTMSLSGMGDLRRAAVESLAHLESLMESALVLRSASDYRYYLTNYAARIAAAVNDDVESCTLRLRELCDELLNLEQPEHDRILLGMSSRQLLKETVLPVVSTNRVMQRLVAEYAESLTELDRLASSKR